VSPSSLRAWEKCPATFYLERQAKDRRPRPEGGLPAAIGSAFDYCWKLGVLKRLPGGPELHEDRIRVTLLESIFSPGLRAELSPKRLSEILWRLAVGGKWQTQWVFNKGAELFKVYRETGLLDKTIWLDIERHPRIKVPGSPGSPGSPGTGEIPMFMKLDGVMQMIGTGTVPMDLKYTSQVPAGWKRSWEFKRTNGKNEAIGNFIQSEGECSKKYRVDIRMEEIDVNWATQLCSYGWALGLEGTSYPAVVHLVSESPEGHLKVCEYIGLITPSWEKQVIERYQIFWDAVQSGSYLSNLPSDDFWISLVAMDEHWW